MTMKKIGLSVLASSLIATSAIAGTASVDSNASTIAEELVYGQDFNTTSVDLNTTYKPTLTAGVNDGKLLVTFTNGRVQSVTDTMLVYNQTQGKIVGNNPQLSGQNSQKLTFDINDSINDYDTLFLADSDDGNASTHEVNASIVLDVLKDSTSVGMEYQLLDNIDNSLDTANAGTVVTTKKQWDVSIASTNKFDAQIDAASSFLKFISDSNTNNTTTTDVGTITITQNAVAVGTGDLTLNVKSFSDYNTSTSGTWTTDLTVGSFTAAAIDYSAGVHTIDQNITVNENLAGVDNNYTTTMVSLVTDEIKETTFKASVNALSATNNPSFAKAYLDKDDFGAWTIYGYHAKVPAASASSDTDTVLTVVNTQTKGTAAQDIYLTLIDADGNECSLNSTMGLASVAQVKPGSKNKYKLGAMLSECTNVSGTAYAIEFNVPTTPTDIYSQAAVLNTSAGRDTKALPVYNNADKY